ncbi:putative autophagy-related protein 7 [Paratrimastix pyriformis]|uniref:Autophagy-related protein 7 n=1 Tax=Paratrimastix pyriformis TaxID=342808 RepID=A0ABQ8UU37_9EUKA|nr:putative autophagy-related protein 7 [Paratrimastix pyriformis]
MSNLQFQPLSSCVDASFWHKLTQMKLDVFKINDAPVPITGYFPAGARQGLPASRFFVDHDAFTTDVVPAAPLHHFRVPGTLVNTNTLADFGSYDKDAMMSRNVAKIWEAITSGQALQNPSMLAAFSLLTFADLKTYNFLYWFAFPALLTSTGPQPLDQPAQPLLDLWPQEAWAALTPALADSPVHILAGPVDHPEVIPFADLVKHTQAHPPTADEPLTLVVADPCERPDVAGWPLRNVLACVQHYLITPETPVRVICYRPAHLPSSAVLRLRLSPLGHVEGLPKAVGWERNDKGVLKPRKVDLQDSLDPKRLAETSVDLNLKLMRWRVIPDLDLDRLKATRCLLLGAGTLGCYVARTLMAWGVRNITLVDRTPSIHLPPAIPSIHLPPAIPSIHYHGPCLLQQPAHSTVMGHVSFSNPVRQPLFCFQDCLGGGRPKAQAAAEELVRIFPGVHARAETLTIPMPGHAIKPGGAEEAQTRADVEKLEKLIVEHDVVYLLMDTRESRWLPSLLCALHGRLVINCALGFDSFVVMRHGAAPDGGRPAVGCYYCNDVVAPRNSTTDRTLDQQCTVTRPGLAPIASALGVELMASVLHHPLGPMAPAEAPTSITEQTTTPMGFVPHQIRGFLTHFQNVLVSCPPYPMCTACSEVVKQQYRERGFSFLLEAFNDPASLEELTGLGEMQRKMEHLAMAAGAPELDATGEEDETAPAGPAAAAAAHEEADEEFTML